MSAGKVLVILPSSRFLKLNDSQTCSVGYHLKELAVPVKVLRQNDYQVLIATPNGETPFIDPSSLCDVNEDERLFYEVLVKENTQMLLPLTLERMSEEFLGTVDGLLIPGGFAALIDFWKNPAIKHILKHMHKHCKPTAAIGHGAIALAYDLKTDENWVYAGYNMTCAPESIDTAAQSNLFDNALPHYVSSTLLTFGASLYFDDQSVGFYMDDHELVTGQDAFSSKAVANCLLDKLGRYQHCRSC